MSKGMEIIAVIFALLCIAGCGYALIKYSLEREKISKFSIIVSLAIGVIGIWGSFADYGGFDTGKGIIRDHGGCAA